MHRYHSSTTPGIDKPNHALLNKNNAYFYCSKWTNFDGITHGHKAMKNIHLTIVHPLH